MDKATWDRQRAALDQVTERQERKAREYADEVRELAALSEAFGTDDKVLLELAGTARIGQDKSAGELLRSTRLVELFPHALELLDAGELYVGTTLLLLSVTAKASREVQAEVGRRVLDRIASMDAADARALIARTVVQVESELELEAQRRRHAEAKANRGVWVMPVEDGMARIGCETDQVTARHFALNLEELVRAQKVRDDRDGVVRTQSQRRADVLAELPARHLALLRALQQGKADALLGQARAGLADDGIPVDKTPVDEPLPLDLPADPTLASSPRPWHLSSDELAVQLLRLPVRRCATLNVHVPMSTLLDLDSQPAIVDGLGPVPAWQARLMVPTAGLRRVMVHPRTGLPFHVDTPVHPPIDIAPGLHPSARRRRPPDDPPGPRPRQPDPPPDTDPTFAAELQRERLLMLMSPVALARPAEPQYAPSAELRRLVQVRDQRCTGPGCSRTATACDLDHELQYSQGGQTAEWNLSAKSPRCHHARHDGWIVTRDADGVSTWTSPAGSTYVRRPAWHPHPPLPEQLRLPTPRLIGPPEAPRSFPDDEHPLWREPQPPTPSTPATPPARPAATWHDDGPLPF